MNDQLHTDLSPLPTTRTVSFSLTGASKKSLGSFERILESKPILPSNTNILTSISVEFDWKYEGRLNPPGKVRIELLSHKDGVTYILAEKIYNNAPHLYEPRKTDIIDSQHDLVQNFNQGDVGTCTFAVAVMGSDERLGLCVRDLIINLTLSSSSPSLWKIMITREPEPIGLVTCNSMSAAYNFTDFLDSKVVSTFKEPIMHPGTLPMKLPPPSYSHVLQSPPPPPPSHSHVITELNPIPKKHLECFTTVDEHGKKVINTRKKV